MGERVEYKAGALPDGAPLLCSDDLIGNGPADQRPGVFALGLPENVSPVRVHRVQADEKLVGNLLAGVPLGNELEHFFLLLADHPVQFAVLVARNADQALLGFVGREAGRERIALFPVGDVGTHAQHVGHVAPRVHVEHQALLQHAQVAAVGLPQPVIVVELARFALRRGQRQQRIPQPFHQFPEAGGVGRVQQRPGKGEAALHERFRRAAQETPYVLTHEHVLSRAHVQDPGKAGAGVEHQFQRGVGVEQDLQTALFGLRAVRLALPEIDQVLKGVGGRKSVA